MDGIRDKEAMNVSRHIISIVWAGAPQHAIVKCIVLKLESEYWESIGTKSNML
jgi:hypothetical protein